MIIFFLFPGSYGKVWSQDLPTLSYFMNNKILYNPGAVGTNETQFSTGIATKFQWTGLDGAPLNNLLWADYQFVPKNMSVALSVYKQSRGAYSNTNYMAYYAYKIYLTKTLKLSMGVSVGMGSVSFSSSQIKNIWNEDDELYLNNLYNNTTPKFGTGFQLYNRNFYLSLSAPDLLTLGDPYKNTAPESFFKKKRNYVAMGGYTFHLSDKYDLSTNVLVKYHPLSGLNTDLNVQLTLIDYFWLGATYSTTGNQALLIGTHISSQMKFGYAFSFRPYNDTGFPLNSHELNLILLLDHLFSKKIN